MKIIALASRKLKDIYALVIFHSLLYLMRAGEYNTWGPTRRGTNLFFLFCCCCCCYYGNMKYELSNMIGPKQHSFSCIFIERFYKHLAKPMKSTMTQGERASKKSNGWKTKCIANMKIHDISIVKINQRGKKWTVFIRLIWHLFSFIGCNL